MNMDLMHLEDFLAARADAATREANRHLAEKARYEDEAQINQGVAIFCERASTRVRGLREFLLQAPSGLTIGITATVEGEPAPAPAKVDEPAAGAVTGDAPTVKGNAPVDEAEVVPAGEDRVDDVRLVADPADAPVPIIPTAPDVEPEMGEGGSAADQAGDEADAVEAAAPVPERLVPRFSVTPEADGLTEYDQRYLDVMRLNLDRHGVCNLKAFDICDIAELDKKVVGAAIGRLIRARRIHHVSQNRYRVALKGASFPPVNEREPVPAKVAAPKPKIAPSAPVPSLQPAAVETVAEKLMELFVRAATNAGDGMAMFGREGLEKRFDVSAHRIEEAVYLLESRGDIEWIQGLKGHITVKVLKMAEAAA
jgi:hypothetical protein